MSSEGKKKRGEAGQSNAKNIAFRYHGYPHGIAGTNWNYTVSTQTGATTHPRLAGARLLNAMILGAQLPYFRASDRLIRAADATIDHLEKWHRRDPDPLDIAAE